MSAVLHRHESAAARRFSQVCVISLAALISSGTGLLAYLNEEPGPGWLRSVVLASAVMVAVSFAGWLISSVVSMGRRHAGSR